MHLEGPDGSPLAIADGGPEVAGGVSGTLVAGPAPEGAPLDAQIVPLAFNFDGLTLEQPGAYGVVIRRRRRGGGAGGVRGGGGMTTAGDVAALLGGARERIRTARATISEWEDPAATLRAWSASGPWQQEAAAGDPSVFGLRPEAGETVSRQWLDREHDRAREERGDVVLIRDGARWWSTAAGSPTQSGEAPQSSLDLVAVLSAWTDPQALTRALDLEPCGEEDGVLRIRATARSDAFDPAVTVLGWGAAWWELRVDAQRGALVATTAFTATDEPFRRVTPSDLAFDEPLDEALFKAPTGIEPV